MVLLWEASIALSRVNPADQGVLSVVSPRGLGRESTEAGHPVQPPMEREPGQGTTKSIF